MSFSFKEIYNSQLLKNIIKKFFNNNNLEVIVRPACFIIRSKKEDLKFVKRIIIFPPHGFTGDEVDLLNPHPEARKAKIRILGKVNPTKKGFKSLVKEVMFNFSLTRGIPTEKTSTYAKFIDKYCGSQLKSWNNWFYVIRENGWGNFHSLVNLSNEWVVVLLEKELVDQKKINIKFYLNKLPKLRAKKLQADLLYIEHNGDRIFDNRIFISKILEFPTSILAPILIQMLNIKETGRHEPCTFFALLLKIAKKEPGLVLGELKRATKLELAPHYYLSDLSSKVKVLK